MRTTLVIDEELFRALKKRAAEEGRTLSDVTQEVLRRGLAEPQRRRRSAAPVLPSFKMGPPLVDVSDRDRLYDLMEKA